MKTITWTQDDLKTLKAGYALATQADKKQNDVFTIEINGKKHDFVVAYARHLIEYLETVFAKNQPRNYPPNLEGEEGQ